ncbi:diguanylate cyclase [bacterium]|nr:diguanylate cyclase [bacterium]
MKYDKTSRKISPQREQSAPGALTGIAVWLVEAEPSTLELYRRLLVQAGANVLCFESVSAFLRKVAEDKTEHVLRDVEETQRPDVVLVDLVLPDDSGVAVIEFCRQHWPMVPSVAYSTFASVEDAVCAMQAGACNFIRKPVHLTDLVVETEKALKHAEFLGRHQSLQDSFRILNIARSLAVVPDRKELLKAFIRALSKEIKMNEGFAFLYDANLTFPEFLLDLRQAGVTRREPFEFVQKFVAPVLADKRNAGQGMSTMNPAEVIHPQISVTADQRFVIIEFGTHSGNRGIVVFSSPDRGAQTLLAELGKLNPLVEQTGRSFQNLDTVASMLLVDELTGLYNQKFLKVTLNQEVARCQRYGGNISLMFIDLDKFKSINDTHGHIVGSEMIKTAARILRDSVRDSDYLLRYGGDEFCAILPNTQLEGAFTLAERIRASFERSVLDLSTASGVASARALKVTTSIGVASFPQCASSAIELVKAADSAMYESKRAGRNRVSLFKKRNAA